MGKLVVGQDGAGNKIVLISDIIFTNKQNIDWDEVEAYLERYVGKIVEMTESKDVIYLGKDFRMNLQVQNTPDKQEVQGRRPKQMLYKVYWK